MFFRVSCFGYHFGFHSKGCQSATPSLCLLDLIWTSIIMKSWKVENKFTFLRLAYSHLNIQMSVWVHYSATYDTVALLLSYSIHNWVKIFLKILPITIRLHFLNWQYSELGWNILTIGLKYFWRSSPSQCVLIFWSGNIQN